MLSDYTCLWAGGEANPWGFPARPCCCAGAREAIIPPLHQVHSLMGEGAEIAASITGR